MTGVIGKADNQRLSNDGLKLSLTVTIDSYHNCNSHAPNSYALVMFRLTSRQHKLS